MSASLRANEAIGDKGGSGESGGGSRLFAAHLSLTASLSPTTTGEGKDGESGEGDFLWQAVGAGRSRVWCRFLSEIWRREHGTLRSAVHAAAKAAKRTTGSVVWQSHPHGLALGRKQRQQSSCIHILRELEKGSNF